MFDLEQQYWTNERVNQYQVREASQKPLQIPLPMSNDKNTGIPQSRKSGYLCGPGYRSLNGNCRPVIPGQTDVQVKPQITTTTNAKKTG